MFEYNYELGQWVLTPYFEHYFQTQSQIAMYLADTINDKWTEQEVYAYQQQVQAIQALIASVYNQQLQYSEDYEAWVTYYAQQNPVGQELYLKQINYLKYLQEKEEKKNKPKDNTNKQENKPKPAPPKE